MPHRRLFLSLFAFVSIVWADYYIDDTNTTLNYSSGPKAAWAPYAVGGTTLELLLPNSTYQVIDAFVCWNHTYRCELGELVPSVLCPDAQIDAACFDTDDCLLTIPFTGSGITVFLYQAGPVGINASITIDGAHAQTNVLSAPPAPAYEIANVSMFDVQKLPSGPHTLSLLVNDLSGSYSGMMFDYAYINESLVVNSTMTTTASASPISSSGSPADIGAIVGGVIALVTVIVASALVCLWMRRRRRHVPRMIDVHSDSTSPLFHPTSAYDPPFTNTTMYDPYVGYNPPTSNNVGSDLTPSRSTNLFSYMPLVPNRLGSSEVRRTPNSLSTGQEILTPFTATFSASNANYPGTQNRKTLSAVSNDTANAPSPQSQTGHSPSDSRQDMSPLLTDEQADFINSLHYNNVPAAAIARVMERMLVDRHAGIREWARETRLARTNTTTTAPPSYDLVAERG